MSKPSFLEPEAVRLLAERGVSVEAYTAWVLTEGARRARASSIAAAIIVAVVLAGISTAVLRAQPSPASIQMVLVTILPAFVIPAGILWRILAPVAGSPADAMTSRALASYGTAKFMRKRLRYDGWNQVIAFAAKWEAQREVRPL